MIDIDLAEYNYNLPDDRIAQYPLEERDGSKLLVYKNGMISENLFKNIQEFIPSDSMLVFNNTKVIRARLLFTKETGAIIEIFILEPVLPSDYALSLSSYKPVEWKCLIGNLKKWKQSGISSAFGEGSKMFKLTAEKVGHHGDSWIIRFSWNNERMTFGNILESAGHIPLPPYINRKDEVEDSERYQTIYSLVRGSVAAPTAGLHFTKKSFEDLFHKGIHKVDVTLHVGAGTFQPVKSDNIAAHEMHTEHFFIDKNAVEAVFNNIGRTIAVGTTSVRTLESLYWLGVKLMANPEADVSDLFIDQWEAYSYGGNISAALSIETILLWMQKSGQRTLLIPTRIIIVPGYKFRIIDGMVTNFHLPKSTLLLLISAWTGNNWKKIYDYALSRNFRFLSYGDSSLLLR